MTLSESTITMSLRTILGEDAKRFLTYSVPQGDMSKHSVVGILDDFSTQCFSPDIRFFPVARPDIAVALDAIQPEYVFVESAWNGNGGSWLYQLTSPTGPKQALKNLILECRRRDIPTVFWNKEDPPHFDEFIGAAKEFDYIFTTEESLLDQYKAASGHSNIGVLQFAAQPMIHSPIQVEGFRKGNVAFAGQYFVHKFKERREQMDMLFPAAQQFGLSIYSRMLNGDENYAFPRRYAKDVVGSLPYSEMVLAYRKHKVFLNVNSVPSSASMCARRIFELSSCKTSTVSSFSPAIARAYSSDEVFTVSSQDEARQILGQLVEDFAFRERSSHLAWRSTALHHLYSHRTQQIASTLGFSSEAENEGVHAILNARSLSSLRRLAQDLARQVKVTITGVTVLLDQANFSSVAASEVLSDAGFSSAVSVCDVKNIQQHVSASAYVALLMDAYDYAPNYLLDLRLYLKHYASTPIVAKGITMSEAKPDSAYSQHGWPEDVEATEFLSGCWLAARDCDWTDLLRLGLSFDGKRAASPGPITLTDRFNIRRTNTTAAGEWTL